MRTKIEKFEKLVANWYGKTEYVILIENLKQALDHRLVLKNVRRVIEFNQNAWLKPYIDINTNLRKKAKDDFEKHFKLMKYAVSGKKPWKMLKNTEISNLSQQKGEEVIWYQN